MNTSFESIIFAGVTAAIGFLFVWVKSLKRKAQIYENQRKVDEIKKESQEKVNGQSLESLVNGANKKRSARSGHNH